MFENRVLRRIFGPNGDVEIGEWENYIFRSLVICTVLYCAVIKPRRMRWVGHVARIGTGEACTGFLCGNRREKGHRVE